MTISVLKSMPQKAVGQTKTVVLQAGASSTLTVIGLLCSNTGLAPQKTSVYLRRSGSDYSIITNGPIPVGNTLGCVGEEGKVVCMPNDAIVAMVDVGLIDVIASYLEQT